MALFITLTSLVAIFAVFYSIFSLYTGVLVTAFAFLFTRDYKDAYLKLVTLPRDFNYLRTLTKGFKRIKESNPSFADAFAIVAEKYPDKHAYVCADTGKAITFREVKEFINNIAILFRSKGYKKGDQVALFMENDIEYMPIWIGLSKIGVVTALINYNLQGSSLEHCMSITKFKGIIYGISLEKNLDTIKLFEQEDLDFFVVKSDDSDHNHKSSDLMKMLKTDSSLEEILPSKNSFSDPVLYLYTSGSTGKPKAAVVLRHKVIVSGCIVSAICNSSACDVVYNCLPLYHGVGGLVFTSLALFTGCTMILRKKFSASSYIKDCINHEVTVCAYIGEMWRYVLAQTPSDSDKLHKIRLTMGNGLRKSLFSEIKSRFGIKHICEFYGSTEGNIGFFNSDNTNGVIGFLFKAFSFLNKAAIIRCDVETGEIIRNEDGLGIECGPGEPGMIVGLINEQMPFYGYINNKRESNKKIAENIFKKGDKVFLTGDLLQRDEYNYLYFVDRIGDTFRWKGENVSTTEVENVISLICPDVGDVVVYPVAIPGNEGNAGMAYILKEDGSGEFNIDQLPENLQKNLPRYAIPRFIRVGKSIDKTETCKYQKATLKKQGFEIDSCRSDEKIYYFDIKSNEYLLLDEPTLQEIKSNNMRF